MEPKTQLRNPTSFVLSHTHISESRARNPTETKHKAGKKGASVRENFAQKHGQWLVLKQLVLGYFLGCLSQDVLAEVNAHHGVHTLLLE